MLQLYYMKDVFFMEAEPDDEENRFVHSKVAECGSGAAFQRKAADEVCTFLNTASASEMMDIFGSTEEIVESLKYHRKEIETVEEFEQIVALISGERDGEVALISGERDGEAALISDRRDGEAALISDRRGGEKAHFSGGRDEAATSDIRRPNRDAARLYLMRAILGIRHSNMQIAGLHLYIPYCRLLAMNEEKPELINFLRDSSWVPILVEGEPVPSEAEKYTYLIRADERAKKMY